MRSQPRMAGLRAHRSRGLSVGGVRARRAAQLAGIAISVGGCAQRNLVSAPASSPGTGTWVAVWLAAALATVVMGVLVTYPAWERRGGARVAVTLLTLQAGAAVVGGSVLFGLAVRSWQLVDAPADAPLAQSLVRISRIDGDADFFALIVLLVVALSGLVALVTSLAARMAASDDATERWAAAIVLGLEIGGAGAACGALLLGVDGGAALVIAALHLPITAVAFATCLPRENPTPASSALSPSAA